jgi:hypothetical protein
MNGVLKHALNWWFIFFDAFPLHGIHHVLIAGLSLPEMLVTLACTALPGGYVFHPTCTSPEPFYSTDSMLQAPKTRVGMWLMSLLLVCHWMLCSAQHRALIALRAGRGCMWSGRHCSDLQAGPRAVDSVL